MQLFDLFKGDKPVEKLCLIPITSAHEKVNDTEEVNKGFTNDKLFYTTMTGAKKNLTINL